MDETIMPARQGVKLPVNEYQAYELTLTQKQIFLGQRLNNATALYNLTFSYLFRGPVQVDVFRRAWEQLVREAGCLRIRLNTAGAVEEARVYLTARIGLQVMDFSGEANPDAAFRQWIEPLAEAPVDLSTMVVRSVLALVDENRAEWVITLNHLIADGYGVFLLYRRLKCLYDAFAAGEGIPALDIGPYEALVQANQAYLASSQYLDDLNYWRAHEKEAPGPVYLYGRTCRAVPAPARRVEVELSEGQSRRLFALAQSPEFQARTSNVALFNLMVTAYSVFLSQVSGQLEFMIGVPYLNRPGALRSVPGLAIASVPLHLSIDPEATYTDLCAQVREVSKEAARHSRLPVPNPNHQFYNVMFNFHNRAYESGAERIERRWFSGCDTFDLVLNVYNPEAGAGLIRLAFDFSCETFTEEQQQVAIVHFLRVLDSLLEDPQRCVMYPCLLTDEEHEKVIHGPNPLFREYTGGTVIEMFAAQADRAPGKTAVESAEGSLTYQALHEQSTRLARFLSAQGIGPGQAVGVYLNRSPELAAAMLAVWKAGATYVPLDSSYPKGRLEYMIQDAEVRVVLTREAMRQDCPCAGVRVLCLEEALSGEWTAALPAPMDLMDEPAYVIYTSGSTGRPKGVVVSHRGLGGYLEAISAALSMQPEDRMLYFAAPGFDASFEEMLPTWLAGATLLLRPGGLLSLGEFNRLLVERGVTIVSLPAAFWAEWVAGLEQSGEGLPPALRIVSLYAEEPNIQRYIAWRSLAGAERVRWLNTYGPTESVVTTSIFEPTAQDGDPATWVRLPIGRPLANHALYLLDINGLPVPAGVPGEIYIGGEAARGYRNLPNESAERFVPDPFNRARGGVMYRSGDRGRLLPSGQFEFLGRIDQQVKLNGFRVELGEIENRLEAHPAVRQAAVCIKDAPGGGRRLVAYLSPVRAGTPLPDAKELRAYLKNTLPDYMLPADFVTLPSLPMTENGKINRAALPEPAKAELEVEKAAAENTLEAQLVSIWSQILEIDSVGIDQDFFNLGGTSLLSVRMFEDIRQKLGVWLPVAALVEAPTIRELARYVETHSSGYRPSCAVLMRAGGPERPFFFVHGWGGGIVGYTELARHLDPRWPVYGLQAAGTAGEEPPDESMDAMVTRYIRAMKSVQPSGPYRFGGYCTGGIIAYAMACRLVADGEQVDCLAIIDGPAPHVPQEAVGLISGQRLRTIWRSIPFWVQDYRALGMGGLRQRLLHKLNKLNKWHKKSTGKAIDYQREDVLANLDDPTPLPDYQINLLYVQGQAIHLYDPQPYPGQVILFDAAYPTVTKAFTSPLDPTQGWRRLAQGGVKVHQVRASHRNIHLPPYCYELAEMLDQDLREADAALQKAGSNGHDAG